MKACIAAGGGGRGGGEGSEKGQAHTVHTGEQAKMETVDGTLNVGRKS